MRTNQTLQSPFRIYFSLQALFIILSAKYCLCENTPELLPLVSSSEVVQPKLLVIVIDGLRWDAINTSHTGSETCSEHESCIAEGSFFTAVQEEGATAAWLTPVFPTTTAPNILTMATGELPVDHGVLDELHESGEWNLSVGVMPVWEDTAQRHLRTALLRWLDCAALHYDNEYLLCADRVELSGADNFLVELTGDAALAANMFISGGYSVVLMRTELISWTARHYGLKSPVTTTMMTELELVLDELFAELREAGLWEEMSVILTSGSGLSSTEPSALEEVSLSECLETDLPKLTDRYCSAGSVLLAPSEGLLAEQVVAALGDCSTVSGGALKTYKVVDLPPEDRWPGDSEELLVVANPGYFLKWDVERHNANASLGITSEGVDVGRGSLAGDGFSVLDWDMNAIFIAKGPGIARGVTGVSVSCPDVHALLQYTLTPAFHRLPPPDTLGGATWMVAVSEASVVPIFSEILGSALLFLKLIHWCSVFNY